MKVKKRDGSLEDLDIDAIHSVVGWSCHGIKGVSVSEVELRANLQFYDGIPTDVIQETLIRSAAELITEDTPNYQYVAGRLVNWKLRKQVYNGLEPRGLWDTIQFATNAGFYTADIQEKYSSVEIDELASVIDHKRDFQLTYAAMEQFRGKYLVRDRVRNKFYETPQVAYMMIAATAFINYPKETRIQYVKDFYDAISKHEISLPTPIMAGLRTPQRQFSSCVVVETGDSLDSITATSSAIVQYVSKKAGIGIGAGGLRAVNSPIRNGDALHTGVIPFFKLFNSAVKSCSQGGVRGGSATLYYPIWHLEVEDLLVLKNNRGTEETRIRTLDYGVQISKLFYERLIEGGNITLFSPSDVPGLYDSFFADQEEFSRLYCEAEADPDIRKKVVSAIELFSTLMQERKDTGRIYVMNVDHCNDHGSFLPDRAPIRMSNLCVEITLPTKPLNRYDDPEGMINLCTLSAINWSKFEEPQEMEKACTLSIRALDAILDYQDYPLPASENATKRYRPLGVGIINLAYWLAKRGYTYQHPSTPALQELHRWSEAWAYYLTKASVDLAKERGACPGFEDTKYSQGLFPYHTVKENFWDDVVPEHTYMPWSDLRADMMEHGVRNATLMAQMPCETSAQISNATNGIEPVRALVSIKQSKDGVLPQVVPEIRKLKNKYDLLWNQKSPRGYLQICAVLQKFIDQAMSVNTSYNPALVDGGQLSMEELLGDLLYAYSIGIKNLYYCNVNDGAGEIELPELPQSENILEGEDCSACVL